MPSNYGISESGVSNRVHGGNHADAYLDMPQSVRTARYGAVDDNDQHLRKKRNQPNEHQFASVASQSTQSEQCSVHMKFAPWFPVSRFFAMLSFLLIS